MIRTRAVRSTALFVFAAAVATAGGALLAQDPAQPLTDSPLGRDPLKPAPNRAAGEGFGPYRTMAVRGAIFVDGTGGPPRGPVDIVVQDNRIAAIRNAGTPGLPMRPNRPPKADYEIDATGMYVLPGFIDLHVHAGGAPKNPDAEYPYKLWLAHGVTTVRGVPITDNAIAVKEKERSARNEIVAPRIFNYQRPGSGWGKGVPQTPEAARAWVNWAHGNGVDGLKLGAERPDLMAALLDEAKKLDMGSTAHLQQTGVVQINAIKAARLGLGTVTHFYGHFESLLKDYVVQPYPVTQNYNNEQDRFGQVARLWDKIHPPGSPEWKAYLEEHLKLGTTFDPTLTIYSAGRDVMRFRAAEWHDKYTLPSLMEFYTPDRNNHGAYWYDWTTEDEVAFRNFYQVWFKLMNDYKKMGGRVTTGSDSGFIYQTYGFGYINEFELLQEAGFHPLEVIQSATMNGALTLYEPMHKAPEIGVVREGMLADMVIVDQNPLQNFKVLYANGTVRLNDRTGKVERVGGIRWTIKDGIAYDAKKLAADVMVMVEKQKHDRGGKPTTSSGEGRAAQLPARN
jgi:imidazolonepropionase-like amidohydrolase